MKTGEFCKITGLSIKTAQWLHDNVFYFRNFSKHRQYSDENVNWVKNLQLKNFSQQHNIKRIKETDYPCYIEDNGTVYNYRRGIMEEQQQRIIAGYNYVTLWCSKKHKDFRVHRLVAQYFIENPNNYKQINHKDGIKTNNHAPNLEWCTSSQNTQHAFDNGLVHNDKGVADSQSHPIAMFDKYDSLIAIFTSVSLAAKYTGIDKTTLIRLAKQPLHFSRDHDIYVRYIRKSDQKCNDYPEIVSYETIGVGLKCNS